MLISIFACILAVSVGAHEFESIFDVDTTTYENGPEWANLADTSSTAVIKRADGSFVRIPTYYIFKANSNNQFVTSGSNFDFSFISEKLSEEITLANLVSFEIPNGTTSINGAIAHATFSSLEELTIPTSITALNSFMLRNNAVLKRVFVRQTMGEDGAVIGLTTLPKWFADATNGGVTAIEEFVFELGYITSLEDQVFQNSNLKSFYASSPITSIGGSVFSGCKKLETVVINNTGSTITMGSKAFAGCTTIKSVTLNGFSLPNYLFENANGLSGGLTFIATNVETVGTQAFKNAANLSVAKISGPITSIGAAIFGGCTYLEELEITNTLDTPTKVGNNMCDRLKNLKSVKLHGVSIGAYSFREINGTDMKVSATNVGYIGEGAFQKAGNITEIYIEGAFEYIGSSTYRECPKLKKLTIIHTGDNYVTSGNGESNSVLEELYLIGNIDIKGSPAFQNNRALKHVYLGEGVREVGSYAFYKCYALETMYMADTITFIGDRAIDMDTAGVQTSESFMFVDENGNMDNTLPKSLTAIDGHFLKHFTIANTQLIFPECFTAHTSTQKFDFEGTKYPEGFSLVYLGKMTTINLNILYKLNNSRDLTVYLANNTSADIKNYRVEAVIGADGKISHGAYAGQNENGTLEIIVDSNLHNNINATGHIKFVFCGTDEVCFVTRVNIVWGTNTGSSWGNFVSTPVSYEALLADYAASEKVAPSAHPIVSAPEYSDATCTEPGGTKKYCLACGKIAEIEKTQDALGHDLLEKNGAFIISVIYDSYDRAGVKTVSCATCHESCEVEALAIFAVLGTSEKEFGNGAITIGYTVNKMAIADLEKTGKTFEYGVYAVSQANLGENDIFGADGAADGVLYQDMTKYKNDAFALSLSGFSEAQKDMAFAMGTYICVTEDGKTTYSFLQLGEVAQGERYSFVTYKSLTNN